MRNNFVHHRETETRRYAKSTLRGLPIHKDDAAAVSASLRSNPSLRKARQSDSHRRDTETQRKTPIGNLRPLRVLGVLSIHRDDEARSILLSAFLLVLLCDSASLPLNPSLRKAYQSESHRRDTETQRKTPIGNLRALRLLGVLPIRKDDKARSILLSAFLLFLLCGSASLRLNPIQSDSHRRDSEMQRKTPIGNLRALRPLGALFIHRDDEAISAFLAAFLVFLLCVSVPRRFNPSQEAHYAR